MTTDTSPTTAETSPVATTAAEASATTDISTIPDRVAAVRAAFDSGMTRPREWRDRQLGGLLALLGKHGEELVEALGEDMGKPPVEAHFTDISFTANDIAYTRKNLARWMRPRKANLRMQERPGTGYVLPEPLGVCLVIAPWNYPVQLTLAPLAAALAAGNTAVVKPSEMVPNTTSLLSRLMGDYVDPDAVTVAEGGPEVSTALLAERFDHIFFTGSTRVGRIVAEAAARNLTPTVLELGGKSPVVVGPDADIERAAERIAWGKGVNAGQTCIAPDYVLAHHSIRERLTDAIAAAFQRFYGDDPTSSKDLANVVNGDHAQRLAGLLADHGGTIVCGGEMDLVASRLAPTVVAEPDPDSPLMTEEIFGPILPVLPYRTTDEAIDFINARPKPLALYVFSETDDLVEEVTRRTSSGGICVNHVMLHIGPPTLPFGGVGESGWGRYHGRSGFDALSNLKPVFKRPMRPDLSFIYPPYGGWKEKLMRKA